MTATEVLASLRDKGITLRADGDAVRLRPRSAITEEDIAAVAAVKRELLELLVSGIGDHPSHDAERRAEVLALLRLRSGDVRDSWPQFVPGLGERHVRAFTPCTACGAGTWVHYGGATPLCRPCATHPTPARLVQYGRLIRRAWTATAEECTRKEAFCIVAEAGRLCDELGVLVSERIISSLRRTAALNGHKACP